MKHNRLSIRKVSYLIVIACIAVLLVGAVQTTFVRAETGPLKYAKKLSISLSDKGETRSISLDEKGYGWEGQDYTTSYKSSNPKVLKVVGAKKNWLKVMKAGKAKITIYVKYIDTGETFKKLTTTVTVYKYSNPFKKIKIAGKDYTKKFKKDDEYTKKTDTGDISGKVSITPAKGWKIKEIWTYPYDEDGFLGKIDNKSTVTGSEKIEVIMYNKSKKLTEYMYFFVAKKE